MSDGKVKEMTQNVVTLRKHNRIQSKISLDVSHMFEKKMESSSSSEME